jgi:predicted secreted acid phosphatase
MIDAVGFDLDSTIANTYHRQWMVPAILAKGPGAPTWDDYSMECANDTPIEGTVALMRMLSSAGHLIFIITGRSAAAEALTRHWLNRHHIPCDALLMRPAGDRTANGKYKVQQIRKAADLGYKVTLFVEDWPEAGDYITEHTGIPCLLVNANYPADAPHQNENSRSV